MAPLFGRPFTPKPPFALPPPVLLASFLPYSMLLFKPGAQGFVMKREVRIVNDDGLDPNVCCSGGWFNGHCGRYLVAKRFN